MFLSRVMINTRRRGARTLMSSPRAMHAATMASFADDIVPRDGRVLWRLDSLENQRASLYVVSPGRPDFTHLIEQAGWPTTQSWESRPYEPLLERLTRGQRWHFRLTANPVHKTRLEPSAADTKITAHVTSKHQEQWLLDRAEQAGFRISAATAELGERDFTVVGRRTHRFNRDGTTVTLAAVSFEGHLEVIESDVLRATLIRGLGRGKAYGCGLLTLAAPERAQT